MSMKHDGRQPFVSVIIPTFNDNKNLLLCLKSLSLQIYPTDRFEVIVVDNGSDESPGHLVSNYNNVVYCEEMKPGSYAARNKAIKFAKGETLAFIDSDIVASKDWIEKGVYHITNAEDVGIVGGKVAFQYRKMDCPNVFELYDTVTGFRQKDYIEKNHFSGAGNLFTKKNVFNAVGVFNESLKSGGDCEWGNRVHSSGYKLVYAEDVYVEHPARYKLSEIIKKNRRVVGGHVTKKKITGYNGKSFVIDCICDFSFLDFIRRRDELKNFPIRRRVGVLFIFFFVSFVRFFERLRVYFGGSPSRS